MPNVVDTQVANRRDSRVAMPDGEILLQQGGSGPPLLFLHGGGAGTWGRLQDLLASSFDVLAPVHPAFGASDEMEGVEGMDDLVYHYLDLLDRLELGRVALVGSSFGGWLAAELAVHSPQRFSELVLISPVGLRIPEHPLRDIFLMTPDERVEILFRHPERLPAPDPTDTDAILTNYKNMMALARFGWSPFMNNPKLERRLYRVTARTLVVAPAEDRLVPRAHDERYASRIAGARLIVVDDAAHVAEMETPEAIAAPILEFLTGGAR
ncbi:MAG: alpha/beta hydrolase [Acidimicrobiaceae bacterium]|nr:alpha/beta hydrolase [Acidimicrobiaceae bacterium]